MVSKNSTQNETDAIPIILNKPFQAFLAPTIILINLFFIIIIICNRKKIHWRRYAHILNLSIADFLTGFVLLIGISVVYGEHEQYSEHISIGLQTAITACMLILSSSHTGICRSQFTAVKKPLQYRSNIKWRWILLRIAITDTIVILYSALKIYILNSFDETSNQRQSFSELELAIIGSGIVYSIITWIFVLRTAYKSQYKKLSKKNGRCPIRNPNGKTSVLLILKLIVRTIKYYKSLMTAGLSLLNFLWSFLPLYVVWTCLSVSSEDIYSCDYLGVRITMAFFFLRGVVDPIVYVLRDANLSRYVSRRFFCCLTKSQKSIKSSKFRKEQVTVISRISSSKTDSEENSSGDENSDGIDSSQETTQPDTIYKF